MTKTELDQLKKIAQAATPGPWSYSKVYHYDQTLQYIKRKRHKELILETASGIEVKNWKFMITFHPTEILSLLEEIEQMKEDFFSFDDIQEHFGKEKARSFMDWLKNKE